MFRFRVLLAVGVLVAVAAVGRSLPTGSVFSETPAGVTADEWHPISETLGLAVRYAKDDRGDRRLVGTLMVREGSRWQSVSVGQSAAGLVPTR